MVCTKVTGSSRIPGGTSGIGGRTTCAGTDAPGAVGVADSAPYAEKEDGKPAGAAAVGAGAGADRGSCGVTGGAGTGAGAAGVGVVGAQGWQDRQGWLGCGAGRAALGSDSWSTHVMTFLNSSLSRGSARTRRPKGRNERSDAGSTWCLMSSPT